MLANVEHTERFKSQESRHSAFVSADVGDLAGMLSAGTQDNNSALINISNFIKYLKRTKDWINKLPCGYSVLAYLKLSVRLEPLV